MPIPENQQQALVARLMQASGGSYSPETRRKFYISGPQWAAAYQGQALFHAPTREPVSFDLGLPVYEFQRAPRSDRDGDFVSVAPPTRPAIVPGGCPECQCGGLIV